MISINPTNNYTPTFKCYRHAIKNKAGDVINRGDTCIFRDDLDLENLIKFLEKKYCNVPKVNVILHACSDGEEAFSFLAKLLNMLGIEKSKKYLPVSARDISEEYLDCARSGNFFIEPYEKHGLFWHIGCRYKDYFDEYETDSNKFKLVIKDIIRNNITFTKADIMDDVKNMELKNTVLFARNLWPYLGSKKVEELARTLSQRMDESSTLIIGDFDKTYRIDDLLCICGLKEHNNIENVFENPTQIQIEKKKPLNKFISKLFNFTGVN